MPRINRVKKARKDQGRRGKCGTELTAGKPYRWIKFRYGGKRVRCVATECRFRNSDLTQSDKLSDWWLALEDIEDAIQEARDGADGLSIEEIACWLKSVEEVVYNSMVMLEEVASGYQESADNMYDAFPSGSYVIDEITEKADSAESARYELDMAKDDLTQAVENLQSDNPTPSNFETALDNLEDVLMNCEPGF